MGAASTRIASEANKQSDNLLSEFCGFNADHTFVASSGGSNAVIEWQPKVRYAGSGGLKITHTATGTIVFGSGADEMECTVLNAGRYWISAALKIASAHSAGVVNFGIEMSVNGVFVGGNSFVFQVNSAGSNFDFQYDQWNTIGQSLALADNDVVDFRFTAQSSLAGLILYFDRLKLEFDDKGMGKPSIYSEPMVVPTP